MKRRKSTEVFDRAVKWGLFGLLLGLAPVQAWELPASVRVIGEEVAVQVRPGQSLYDIARAEGYALEHLAEANGLPVSLAALGQAEVIVPKRRILPANAPSDGLVVNIPERGFYLFREAQEPLFFPIAVGEPGRFETPPGRYAIREKVKDPQWIAPEWAGLGEDNVVEAGPNNPLGDRWIGLTASGLGMHSTNNPSSIGSATSHGCMRMYPEIARKVFDLVETGWPVRIEYETSRLAVLPDDGIYLSAFPDVYRRGHQRAGVEQKYRDNDLWGFFQPEQVEPILNRRSGRPSRLVELSLKAQTISGKDFPAARLGKRVWIESDLLQTLGVESEFQLEQGKVLLRRGDSVVSLALHLDQSAVRPELSAFLSRGSAWFPAREVLSGLKIPYKWDGESSRLKVES